jgi:hypothetical protein
MAIAYMAIINELKREECFTYNEMSANFENGIYTLMLGSTPLALKLKNDWYFNIDIPKEEHGIDYETLKASKNDCIFLSTTETLKMIIER